MVLRAPAVQSATAESAQPGASSPPRTTQAVPLTRRTPARRALQRPAQPPGPPPSQMAHRVVEALSVTADPAEPDASLTPAPIQAAPQTHRIPARRAFRRRARPPGRFGPMAPRARAVQFVTVEPVEPDVSSLPRTMRAAPPIRRILARRAFQPQVRLSGRPPSLMARRVGAVHSVTVGLAEPGATSPRLTMRVTLPTR